MKIALLLLLALTSATPQSPPPPAAARPAAPAPAVSQETAAPEPALESWRFNARERTARGLAAWNQEKPEEAVAPLDSALRLRPDDPLTNFNAGAAHLAAGRPDAERLLERATEEAPPGLAADSFYNLGNARLAQKNAAGAIEAYKESLRREPSLAGAKRNLELALRLLEEQKQQQQQQQNQPRDQNEQQDPQQSPQDPKSGEQGDDSEKSGEPSQGEDDSSQEQQQQQPHPGDHGGQPNPGSGDTSQLPLPQFQDQQDMT
ncbi:MAG: tetratricopeptide repeat protein, partial [Thermoanaerobaculia bacterium]